MTSSFERASAAARIDVNQEYMSAVNFTSSLMEFIMMTVGHTSFRAGVQGKEYILVTGSLKFRAPADKPQDAVKKMLYYVLTADMKMTPEEYVAEAQKVIEMENKEAEELINTLAEGGLSDFGKKVEEYRTVRGGLILRALDSLSKADKKPTSLTELLERVQESTGYSDIDSQEVLIGLGELSRVKKLFPD